METFPVLLVAFFAVCMMQSALALECYECTSTPGSPGVSRCSSGNIGKITCPQFYDRCYTIKFNMTVRPGVTISAEMRNCSNSMACDPGNQLYSCTLVNTTGILDHCELACCQDNLCDPYKVAPTASTSAPVAPSLAPTGPASAPTGPTSAPTGPTGPASAASVLAANFSAILLASVLNMFA